MPDGHVKAEEAHPGLLQSKSIWFTACDELNIIDNPLHGSLNFEICYSNDRQHNFMPKLVYDNIDNYFEFLTDREQLNDVCYDNRCLLLPVEAEVVGVDDYDEKEWYIVIKPSHVKDNRTITVHPIEGNAIYGKVNMIYQPKNWDIYGDHVDTLLKIHLED